jgi:hypothetical protein
MTEVNRTFPTELLTIQAPVENVAIPESDFTPEELAYFATRSDSKGSKAARSLAKQLLRDWLQTNFGSAPAASDLAIISDGKPPGLICDQLPHRIGINISLAHSATHAACALLIEEKL